MEIDSAALFLEETRNLAPDSERLYNIGAQSRYHDYRVPGAMLRKSVWTLR